jgi:hypothetical protein
MRDVLEALDVDAEESALELLAYRYDPEHTGKTVCVGELLKAMGLG